VSLLFSLINTGSVSESLTMVTTKGESTLTSTAENGHKFIHRVKIVNLPPHEMGSVKKLLQTFDLHKYKKAPKWDYAYMNFEVIKNILFGTSQLILMEMIRQRKLLV
jgi:hypothetical protein